MKKIIVNSASLLTALQYAKKVMVNNPTVPILENFLFDVKNGRLTVSGSDLQSTFKVTLPARYTDTKDTFQACVPAEIMKYLAKLDAQPISIIWDAEKYSIEVLDDENARAKYSGENPKDFPLSPQTDSELFEITSDLFKEFKDLLVYASNDEVRPAMTGIGFVTRLGKFYMAATNGHVLKQTEVPYLSSPLAVSESDFQEFGIEPLQTKIKKYESYGFPYALKQAGILKMLLKDKEEQTIRQHFILPSKPAKILSDLKFGTAKKPITETVNVCAKYKAGNELTNISFLFSLEGYDMELITRNIDEPFPQFWNVIPTSTPAQTKFTVEKKRFLSVLDKAYLFANKTTRQIRLGLNGSNRISAEDLEFSNEFSAEVGGTYVGEHIEIGFNAELLKDVVSSFGETFTLEMWAPNKAAVIRDGNSLALCMPVMLNQYV